MQEFYIQYHINRQCNLRCKHCYQDTYADINIDRQVVDKITSSFGQAMERWSRLLRISITGGEPFLYPEIFDYLSTLASQPWVASIGILTNGTLIDNDRARTLSRLPKLREVQVSLDGASPATHDAIRGTGSFLGAVAGIEKLVKFGVPTAIMCTISKTNAADALNVLELAKEKQVDSITIERVTPTLKNISENQEWLLPEELHSLYGSIHAWAVGQKGSHIVNVRRTRPLWAAISDKIGGFCPVGISSLAVLEDGTILPCRRLEIPLGNILKDGSLFPAFYTSPILKAIRNRSQWQSLCLQCSLLQRCGGCLAMAYAITGDFTRRDPQCWLKKEES